MAGSRIDYVDQKTAESAKSVVMVAYSPISGEPDWLSVSIEVVVETGNPMEIDCVIAEIETIAVEERMTWQGMRVRAEEIARQQNIARICCAFHNA